MARIPVEGRLDQWRILSVDDSEPVPFEYEDLVDYVWARLRCPVSFDPSIYGDWGPRLLSFALWRDHMRDYEVDFESGVLDFYDGGDESEVPGSIWECLNTESPLCVDPPRALALNISTWSSRARTDYVARTGLLRSPVAGRTIYAKHFPPPSCSSFEDLKKASLSNANGKRVSRLLYNIEYEHIHHLASAVQVDFFTRLIDADFFRGAIDCLGVVGLVEGHLTNFLAIEWSHASIHVYPVTEAQAKLIGQQALDAQVSNGLELQNAVPLFPANGIVGYDGWQGQGTLTKTP